MLLFVSLVVICATSFLCSFSFPSIKLYVYFWMVLVIGLPLSNQGVRWCLVYQYCILSDSRAANIVFHVVKTFRYCNRWSSVLLHVFGVSSVLVDRWASFWLSPSGAIVLVFGFHQQNIPTLLVFLLSCIFSSFVFIQKNSQQMISPLHSP